MTNSRYVLFLTLLTLLISHTAIAQEATCEEGPGCTEELPIVCGVSSHCVTSNPFYQRGGSAQAYTPGAPVKSSVCDPNLKSSYKASTWPFGRKTHRKAPKVTVNIHLYECSSTRERRKNKCCCAPLSDSSSVKIEVWQAQPNGRYSSLSKNDGICRATLEGSSFTTLAPGSTGILGGLGPNGLDFMPYGAPTIHMLFTSSDHQPLLVHLPIVLDRKLEARSFFGPDWRGPAYLTKKILDQKYSIQDWMVVKADSIVLDLNIYLNKVLEPPVDISKTLCPSTFYGSPSSFFLEPIAVCAPSILDFFEL